MSYASDELGTDSVFARGRDSASSGGCYSIVKPQIERLVAAVMFIALSPMLLLIMLLVRLTSRGPALFQQRRLGGDGQVFIVYKIRSMYVDCELHTGPVWSLPGDPRVTPIGKILRWTHIDELPQLVNVIRGEMSLVGPRPERPEFARQLEIAIPDYAKRLAVRPGLTGLAQILFLPDTDLGTVRRKLNYDLYYIKNLTFWLDVRIFVGTIPHVLGIPSHRIAQFFGLPDETIHDDEWPQAQAQANGIPTNSSMEASFVK